MCSYLIFCDDVVEGMVFVRKKIAFVIVSICILTLIPIRTFAGELKHLLEVLLIQYEDYESRFDAIYTQVDIKKQGFTLIEDQCFPVVLESFSEEEIYFLPIIDRRYGRLGVLLADTAGNIVFKTDQLETNNRFRGQMKQPTKGIAAVSFQDMNQDGLTDIVLITNCENSTGEYAHKNYKIGDVLFQTEGSFYRDWRISDKINRFSMNKSIDFIRAYVRDGHSTEILYTATTLEELLDKGFKIFETQCYTRRFEKQGMLKIVPGIIEMAEYDIFMIYLVNDQGYIVWSFQPMEDYDNLYAMKGMACRDLDGDGMKDLIILGRYSYAGPDGALVVDTKCDIYYQRTEGFDVDTQFRNTYQCTEEDTVEGLVKSIRAYWGWQEEQ